MEDSELALPGHKFRIIGFMEQGDIAADWEITARARIAEALRQPLYLADLAMWKGMWAILEGRFAVSEEQVALGLRLLGQSQEMDAT